MTQLKTLANFDAVILTPATKRELRAVGVEWAKNRKDLEEGAKLAGEKTQEVMWWRSRMDIMNIFNITEEDLK